jgi:acetate kinase
VRVLVVNVGSSSLKLSVLDGEERIARAEVERWDGDDVDPLLSLLEDVQGIDAIGHRFVHGGARHVGPSLLDAAVLQDLEQLIPLAPLHQPRALAGLRAAERALPGTPSFACFDTAFHRSMPAAASTYALPADWNARWGLRRYGFHGLSHAYASHRAAQLVDMDVTTARIVCCHLGAGASLCAVRAGRSVDTTMGFTPLEGLVMRTRSGSVDPGLLLWLLSQGVAPEELTDALEHRSGLAGLSGTSGDLRDVLQARSEGSADAALAYDVMLHRLGREIGAMAGAAGGLDLLVLTGGMAEHSPQLRADLCERMQWLGVAVSDADANLTGDADLSSPGARVRTVLVEAREDLQIAREVARLAPAG